MATRIIKWLAPPVFEDEDKTHAASLLNTTLLIVLTAAVLYPLTLLITGQTIRSPVNWIILLLNVVTLILIILLRRGHVQLAGALLSLMLWASFTIPAYTFDGIHDTAINGYFVVIVLTSLVSGGRTLLLFCLLSIAAVAGAYYAEQVGALVVSLQTPPSLEDPVLLTVLLGVTALLLRVIVSRIAGGYERVRLNEQALIESNRELENSRATLEARTRELEESTAELAARSAELEAASQSQAEVNRALEESTRRQAQANRELQEANEQNRLRAARLRASAEVSRAVAQIRNLDELLPRVTELISQYFGYYHAGVFLTDPAGRFAVLRAANSAGGQRMLARGHKLEVGVSGIVGRVTHTGEPRIALDVGEDAVYFDNPDLPDTRSEMALPLRIGDQVIGALDVQSTEPGAFDQEDIDVLFTLADQVAIAIENARLLQQAREAVEVAETAQRQYLQEQWQRVAQRQLPRGEWQITGLQSEAEVEDKVPLTASEQALEQGELVILENNDATTALGVSALAAPIKLRGQTIGVLDLQETEGEHIWSQDEIALVQAVADQVAQALETARLFDDTRRRAQREQATRQITDRIRGRTEVDDMLQTAIRELARTLGTPRVFVRLDPEMFETETSDKQGSAT